MYGKIFVEGFLLCPMVPVMELGRGREVAP
jgi:hypothetical protein